MSKNPLPLNRHPRPSPAALCSSADVLFDPEQSAAAGGSRTIYTRFAATLAGGVAAFDAAAFRLVPGEAALMDPHARLLLEHSAEALADAGARQPAGSAMQLHGSVASSTGVFVGCMWASGECQQDARVTMHRQITACPCLVCPSLPAAAPCPACPAALPAPCLSDPLVAFLLLLPLAVLAPPPPNPPQPSENTE